MNRFRDSSNSVKKNELVGNLLSYVDWLRPAFFLMENVAEFMRFRGGEMVRRCVRALTMMDYQVTFTVLQAGQFVLPQDRKRFILLAAGPGQTLPWFPRPSHVFPGGVSAPFRRITVGDAISDLPPINGTSYLSEPKSIYQRLLRGDSTGVSHQSAKTFSPLIQKRMELIPLTRGSDWRDLPNTELELSDGTKTKKLEYNFEDETGALRGVCRCADGVSDCGPGSLQKDTIIPSFLAHKASQ